jgi:hypothetical protein
MANFSFTVDTQEMAAAIDDVSAHVNGVSAAVIGMQGAVIAAEAAAADRVCRHVDAGFFSLIRAQITQKMAALRSRTDSCLLELRQQTQTLAGIKTTMERDYQMISERYRRVFRSIDASLRNRVFELDKAVTALVHREIERVSIRQRSLQAQVPIHQTECVQNAQTIAVSHAKGNAIRSLRSIQGFLAESSQQAHLLESMFFQGLPQAWDLRFVPLLVRESDSSQGSGTQWDLFTARSSSAQGIGEKVTGSAQGAVYSALPSLRWAPSKTEMRTRVGGEFRRMVGQASIDERVREQMVRLFDAAPWQELSGGRS